jgi:cysteinyl-tRNA synthetase
MGSLKLFDSMSGGLRKFVPLQSGRAGIYTCGPSVYDYSHIGNFRTYVAEDILVRYLAYKGLKVRRVMNITDVEDKAVRAAVAQGVGLADLQKQKIRGFFSDWDVLGLSRPDVIAYASGHVPQMVKMIERICARGFCVSNRSGVYFNIRKMRGYGKMSGLKDPEYFGRAPGDDYSKCGLWDFRLWKRWSRGDGNIGWDSPFGFGRPGWHIECTAMATRYLGEYFDLHCGGSDNVYPHHENEIAQSFAANRTRLAKYWFHTAHLVINSRKMSKRTGNVVYVRDILEKGYSGEELRAFLMCGNHRMTLNFTYRDLKTCALRLREMRSNAAGLCGGRPENGPLAKRLLSGFNSRMDNGLNVKSAMNWLDSQIRQLAARQMRGALGRGGAAQAHYALKKIDSVVNVLF